MVIVDGPHHAGPWPFEHEVPLPWPADFLARLVKEGHGNAEEGEALCKQFNNK